jgi:glyoxylase-like metal-dependent hydrolase (beta-lactamase superfamily II)
MKSVLLFAALSLAINGLAQNKTTNSYKTDSFELITLNENQGKGTPSILLGATPEMLEKAVPDGSFANAINYFLLKMDGKNILFDSGISADALVKNLSSLNLKPKEIDQIILTHAHGDHIGGLLKDGKAVFPKAEIYISKIEHDYWLGKKNELYINLLEAYGDRLKFVSPSDLWLVDIMIPANGIFPIAAYGHTPGHTMYLIGNKRDKDKVLIWGDIAHAMAVQMPFPQVAVTYDVRPQEAIETRFKVLDFVVENNLPVAGMHIPFSGMVEIRRDADYHYIFTEKK